MSVDKIISDWKKQRFKPVYWLEGEEEFFIVQLINTLDEKIELLAGQELDHLVIVPFTKEFSNLSADEYINDFLIGKFHYKDSVLS